jgi:multicomponent Na+:H+ antiporter subunit E
MPPMSSATILRTVLLRGAILSLGWWILSEGSRAGVGFGAVVVALALAASLWLSPPTRQPWRLVGLVRFVVHFLYHSVRGGVDVARRAFAPSLPLAPALLAFPARLPPGPARDVFTATLSLMPGTLAVEQGDRDVVVHVLVEGDAVEHELAALERRIAHAMGTEAVDG